MVQGGQRAQSDGQEVAREVTRSKSRRAAKGCQRGHSSLLTLPRVSVGMDSILDHTTEVATAKLPVYDLKLRIIGGDGSDGALDLSDLEALIQFIQGAASQDPSLANLSLIDVKKGSRVAVLRAQPHHGIPGLLSATHAISEIFRAGQGTKTKKSPVELPQGVLNAFKTWTRGGAKVEVAYHPEHSVRPKKILYDQKALASAKTKTAKVFSEKVFVGRLVRLHSDEDLFGVETNQGVLHCPFPLHEKESWVALYERIVSIRVKVPPRPASGSWKASETLDIQVQPDPPSLDFGGDIPGFEPPKLARKEGFTLADLFPGLQAEDADSLTSFLDSYRKKRP